MSATPQRRRKRVPRGWVALALTLALLLVVLWLDARWKTGAPHDGYCPEGARWVVAAEDFANLWKATAESEAVQRLCEEWPRPLRNLELAVRKKAGIRPTPQRWRLWCGSRFLMARADGAIGLCVYPGVLARVAHLANRVSLRANGSDGVFRFGALRYGWRDGFLIVSESGDYVAAALKAPRPVLEASSGPTEVRVAWSDDREGWLRIESGGRFVLQGRVRAAIDKRDAPLTLPEAWPEPPIVTVTASSTDDALTVLACLEEPLRDYPEWHYLRDVAAAMWARWGLANMPEGWDDGSDQCSLALSNIGTGEPLPVPEFALVLRGTQPVSGPHPLEALFRSVVSVPYEWQERPGNYVALLGEQMAPCLAGYERDWILATREPLMRELMGGLASGPAVLADASVRLDWTRAGETAEAVIRTLGELELVPGRAKGDVNAELLPIARGAAQLGRLELDAYSEGEWMRFEGALATAIAEDAP
ncbi:MAG: hypothetical protein GY851_25115 [bacterium]|nr:hypothetical protein [bacterium]